MAHHTNQEVEDIVEVSITGRALLDDPVLNKGSAFPEDERREFGLLGLLPPHVSTVEEQLARTYENYKRKEDDVERYIFLTSLQDRNETLFYRLVQEHIAEMVPVVYTPVVGAGCQQYSHIYRKPRGIYISYPDRDQIAQILGNAPSRSVQAIVVSDGERILGLGDLGIGGMGIPVGKLSLYTLCAGIAPATTLPILLDTGTDNESLLSDPLYLGWRHRRVRGQDYDDFIEAFVQTVMLVFPNALLQWEDFAKNNALRLLERYQHRLCTFNDDIQGTGAVTLAGLLAATALSGSSIGQERIMVVGAGSAATGICDQLVTAIVAEGIAEGDAIRNIWLIDSEGLVHSGRPQLSGFKLQYAQPAEQISNWHLAGNDPKSLLDAVQNIRPTVLIGTSAQPGVFTRQVVEAMAAHVDRPIIFPLSNPTSKSEAVPADVISWTGGRALIATGSPFDPVHYGHRVIDIGQCNNCFIFPGMVLGVIASGALRVKNEMFVAAARALAELSPALRNPGSSLYPPLESVRELSQTVALAVGLEAQRLGLAEPTSSADLERRIAEKIWSPRYLRYRRAGTPHS
ncbi:MAG TPA: NAD-dependent malic enzyme [Blastocatellia bacterium]|nr:NAD-dependent malic enzyme [Blastocatellia bacterium]